MELGIDGYIFLITVHTMMELKMTGNCLKGSRPLLSFDKVNILDVLVRHTCNNIIIFDFYMEMFFFKCTFYKQYIWFVGI